MKREIIKQFVNFTGVGAIGTVAHYSVLVFLVELVNINVVTATTIGFIVGAITNYLLNYYYTFKSKKPHLEASVKFFSVATLGAIINSSIMWLLVSRYLLPYMLAQVISTGVVLVWSFITNRLWTFSKKYNEYS